MKNEQIYRDLGRAYASQSTEFLKQKGQGEAGIEELGVFYGSASAAMLALQFSFAYRMSGPKAAEDFLKQTLASLSAGIRLQKIPAMVKVEASVVPTEQRTEGAAPAVVAAVPAAIPAAQLAAVPAATPEAAAEATPEGPVNAPVECRCVGTPDCKVCGPRVTQAYKNLCVTMLSMLKMVGQRTKDLVEACPACAIMYSDQALAHIAEHGVPQFEGEPQELANQVFGMAVELAGQIGVTGIPLTQAILNRQAAAPQKS